MAIIFQDGSAPGAGQPVYVKPFMTADPEGDAKREKEASDALERDRKAAEKRLASNRKAIDASARSRSIHHWPSAWLKADDPAHQKELEHRERMAR